MMRTLLIIEDEISFLTELRMELSDLDINIEWCQNFDDANKRLNDPNMTPNLVLMDLMLNGVNHGPVLASFCEKRSIPYIVMTSHNTMEVYKEMTALKPEAFYSKPLDHLSLKYFIGKYFVDHEPKKTRGLDGIYVRKKSALLKIQYDDIDFLLGEGNYVTIHSNNQKFVIRKSLKQIGIELPSNSFVRVHRNYIVKIEKVEQVDFSAATIYIAGQSLPLGRSYKKSVKQSLTNLK